MKGFPRSRVGLRQLMFRHPDAFRFLLKGFEEGDDEGNDDEHEGKGG